MDQCHIKIASGTKVFTQGCFLSARTRRQLRLLQAAETVDAKSATLCVVPSEQGVDLLNMGSARARGLVLGSVAVPSSVCHAPRVTIEQLEEALQHQAPILSSSGHPMLQIRDLSGSFTTHRVFFDNTSTSVQSGSDLVHMDIAALEETRAPRLQFNASPGDSPFYPGRANSARKQHRPHIVHCYACKMDVHDLEEHVNSRQHLNQWGPHNSYVRHLDELANELVEDINPTVSSTC